MTNIAGNTAITNSQLLIGQVKNLVTTISNVSVTNGSPKHTVSFIFSHGAVGQITKL